MDVKHSNLPDVQESGFKVYIRIRPINPKELALTDHKFKKPMASVVSNTVRFLLDIHYTAGAFG